MLTKIFNRFKERKIDLKKINKILVIATHGIGDVVMLIPFLEKLRQLFPNSNITIMLKSVTEKEIIEDLELIDDYIFFKKENFNNIWGKIKFIKAIFNRKYDLCISTTGINKISGMILAYLSSIKYRIGEADNHLTTLYNFPIIINKEKHKIVQNLDLLKPFGIEPVLSIPNLSKLNLSERKLDIKKNEVVIGFHPGSGEIEKHKRWPIKYYIDLYKIIRKNYPNVNLFLFGGLKEGVLTKKIIKGIKNSNNIYDFAGKLKIKETAAIMKKCSIIIGGDSGLMHLAAALNIRIVSIFGPTDPKITRPIGYKVTILKGNIPCMPCYPKLLTGCKDNKCMKIVKPNMVYKCISSYLKVYNPIKILNN